MNHSDLKSLTALDLSEEHKELLAGYKALCMIKEKVSTKKLNTGICNEFTKSYKSAYHSIFGESSIVMQSRFNRIMKKLALELGTEQSYPVPAPEWFYKSAKIYLICTQIYKYSNIAKNSYVTVEYVDETGKEGKIPLNSFKDTFNQIIEHAAYKVLPRWTGDYGKLRLEFLDKLIACYTEEINSEIVDKY